MKKTLPLSLLLSASLFAVPGIASASTRYASPTGTGPVATCPQDDPCNLVHAMDYSWLHDGDEVVFGPGTYVDPDGYFGSDKAVSVHGEAGKPRPVIAMSANSAFFDDAGLKLSDVRIEATGGATGLYLKSGTAERIDVRSSDAPACFVAWTTMRDSICASEAGAAIYSGYSNPYTYEIKLRNVTAVTSTPIPAGAAISMSPGSGNHITLDAKNVVAYNADPDGIDIDAGGGTGASSQVMLAGSNYDHVTETQVGSVTPAGSGDNVTLAPAFADLSAGDLHPIEGSATVDAGIDDALNGTTDLDGGDRVIGDGIDAGAYEYVPKPVSQPPVGDPPPPGDLPPAEADPDPDGQVHPIADDPTPETTITKAPARKSRRTLVTLRFSSDLANASFACSVDGGSYGVCSSPYRVRLARGRHTIDVRAVSADGRVDQTPARVKVKIARRR